MIHEGDGHCRFDNGLCPFCECMATTLGNVCRFCNKIWTTTMQTKTSSRQPSRRKSIKQGV